MEGFKSLVSTTNNHKFNQKDVTPYENLNVTTMTLVMSLTGGINVEAAFHLLPITRVDVKNLRKTTKCRIPHCDIPGAILSMRYGTKTMTHVRGIIKTKAKPFKNAVTIDISTKVKNISLKLSAFSIQMCGASSKEDGIEAAEHVINHLWRIQSILNKMHKNPNQTQKVIDWVKQVTIGEPIIKHTWITRNINKVNLRIHKTLNATSVYKYNHDIPDTLDKDIALFALSFCDDFMYYEDMIRELDYLPNITNVIEPPLSIRQVDEAMVNYNYTLGFEIDRDILNAMIDGHDGFISRYNNALVTCVTIELPYVTPQNMTIKRRKGKIPHHTFLVYRSGSVTQSGPGGELMKQAYYQFMNTISQLLPNIIYHNTKPRKPNRKRIRTKVFNMVKALTSN